MMTGNEPGSSTGNFTFIKLPVFHAGVAVTRSAWASRGLLADEFVDRGHDVAAVHHGAAAQARLATATLLKRSPPGSLISRPRTLRPSAGFSASSPLAPTPCWPDSRRLPERPDGRGCRSNAGILPGL